MLKWIGHITPPKAVAVMNDELTINDVVESVNVNGDSAMIGLMKQQLEDMKEMYEKMLDSKHEEHKELMD